MSTKKRSVKSLAEKIVPIPPEFYEGNKDEDLIASKTVLVPFAVLLQFAQWAAFAAFVAYYSLPASYFTESTIQGASLNTTSGPHFVSNSRLVPIAPLTRATQASGTTAVQPTTAPQCPPILGTASDGTTKRASR